MALDSRELMLEKFVLVNKDRYPEFAERIAQVTVSNMSFDTIAKDPNNPLTGRVSNLGSEKLTIEANEQSWECGLMNGPKVLNFTSDTLYTTLESITDNNTRGVFKYQASESSEIEVIQILPTSQTNVTKIAESALIDLNILTNYRIKPSEVTVEGFADNMLTILINGDTLYGHIKIIITNPDQLKAGDSILGYYGQVLSSDFISPELLTEQLGFATANIINQGNNVWLKFSYNGKTLLISQKPTAKGVSYNDILGLHLIDESRKMTIKFDNYAVRIPKGTPTDVYRDIDDLIYRVSVNDPSETYWESFSDDDLGIAQTSVEQGQWNWIVKPNGVGAQLPLRLGDSLTGETVADPNDTGLTRGFRPVLIMEGVYGIEDDPSFIETPPLRLIPVSDNSFFESDSKTIKGAELTLYPGVTNWSGYSWTDYVVSIREITYSLPKVVTPPLFNGSDYGGVIKGFYNSPTVHASVSPIKQLNYSYGPGDSFSIRQILKITGYPYPLPNGYNYVGTTSRISLPITIKTVGNAKQVNALTYSYGGSISRVILTGVKDLPQALLPNTR